MRVGEFPQEQSQDHQRRPETSLTFKQLATEEKAVMEKLEWCFRSQGQRATVKKEVVEKV